VTPTVNLLDRAGVSPSVLYTARLGTPYVQARGRASTPSQHRSPPAEAAQTARPAPSATERQPSGRDACRTGLALRNSLNPRPRHLGPPDRPAPQAAKADVDAARHVLLPDGSPFDLRDMDTISFRRGGAAAS
jgi:hypothetical protein